MLVYRSGMNVSTQHLRFVTNALRTQRKQSGTRWRVLSSGQQALMLLAHLKKGETYRDLAIGFKVGTSTAYRYLREGLEVLAGLAPPLEQAIQAAAKKAYVTLDGTLLRIDRVAMASKGDRIYYSGKHKTHGVNVQVIADPAGRLIWASPALPGARHDAGAAKEHGIPAALGAAGVNTFADTAYIGAAPTIRAPFRRLRHDRSSHLFTRRELSTGQKAVNTSISQMRAPGERANADLKSWRLLHKIRSSPAHATRLVNAVQVVILNS
ncbi:transposase family protein [Kineosporia succinea]|nr:transposase family protein [Kineosporia succinea]